MIKAVLKKEIAKFLMIFIFLGFVSSRALRLAADGLLTTDTAAVPKDEYINKDL